MYGSCLVKKESEGFIMDFEMNGTVLKKYRGAGGACSRARPYAV
jgi:hypothetical protein